MTENICSVKVFYHSYSTNLPCFFSQKMQTNKLNNYELKDFFAES